MTAETACPVIRQCWADLVKAEPGNYFSLFDSMVVDGIINRVLANAIEIRTGRKRQGNGASLLITGVRGVGKTTIMRGLCSILQELEPKLVCVYHNYELEKRSLVDLLRVHFSDLAEHATFTEQFFLPRLHHRLTPPLLGRSLLAHHYFLPLLASRPLNVLLSSLR